MYLCKVCNVVNAFPWLSRVQWLANKFPYKAHLEHLALARFEMRLLRTECVKKIQALFRGRKVRSSMQLEQDRVNRERAAMFLTATIRAYVIRRRYLLVRRAITCLQRLVKQYFDTRRKVEHAAVWESTVSQLAHQLRYWFSDENLARDWFMYNVRLENGGIIPYDVLAGFNRTINIVGDFDSRTVLTQAAMRANDPPHLIVTEKGIGRIEWQQHKTPDYYELERHHQQFVAARGNVYRPYERNDYMQPLPLEMHNASCYQGGMCTEQQENRSYDKVYNHVFRHSADPFVMASMEPRQYPRDVQHFMNRERSHLYYDA